MSFILPTGQELSFDIAFVRSHLRRIAVFLYTHKNGLKAVGALPPLIPYSNATTVRVLFRISFGLFTRRRTAYYFFSTIKNVKKHLTPSTITCYKIKCYVRDCITYSFGVVN